MAITAEMVGDLRGREVYDKQNEKVGKVGEVYVDNTSGDPKWATVNTGLFGTKESFVPLDGASTDTQGVHVATDKKTIKDAPQAADGTGELTEVDQRQLYSHYGRTSNGGSDARNAGQGDGQRGQAGSGAGAQGGGGAEGLTRSEERLNVGKEQVETGQVRLRKYVVTENQQVDVPVSHEEVRLEREPVADDRPARSDLGEDEQSVTLHAEKPVVSKEAHEVENVRLGTRSVTENQTVTDEVRKEEIDVDDPSNALGEKNRSRDKK